MILENEVYLVDVVLLFDTNIHTQQFVGRLNKKVHSPIPIRSIASK